MKFRLEIRGTKPLLMHNVRLANPLDPITRSIKEVSGKQKKTDVDHERMAQLEFKGSLYIDDTAGPYIPAPNIKACLVKASKATRGLSQKLIPAVDFVEVVNPLEYVGPRTADALWADENYRFFAMVRVTSSRIARMRPVFRMWQLEAVGTFDETQQVTKAQLEEVVNAAGSVGLGDWRPTFGTFEAKLTWI